MAASATLALKAGACVRRVRFVIVAPDPRHSRRSQAGFPLNELSEFGRPPLQAVLPLEPRADIAPLADVGKGGRCRCGNRPDAVPFKLRPDFRQERITV